MKTFTRALPSLSALVESLGGSLFSSEEAVVRCPAHADSSPSLSLSLRGGRLLWRCHAGCPQDAVMLKLRPFLEGDASPIRESKKIVDIGIERSTAEYKYFKPDGSEWFRVVRFDGPEGKRIRFKHRDPASGRWVFKRPKGSQSALYGSRKLERLRGQVPVLICEGEKNCDFLRKLLGDDFIQVTNAGGAKNWCDENSAALSGCEVIILEDCDDPGRERTQRIARSLPKDSRLLGVLRFEESEVGVGGDIQDWVESGGASREDVIQRLVSGLVSVGQASISSPDASSEEPSQADYFKFFEELFPTRGKDLFTRRSLFFCEEERVWKSILNQVNCIKSDLLERSRVSGVKFKPHHVVPHLEKWCGEMVARLLVEIPEWDGEDRLKFMAVRLCLPQDSRIDNGAAYEILCEWMANLWRKWRDPFMSESPSRSFVLVLQGPEKIGKDYWVRSLLSGLGQWFSDLTISGQERDNLMQLVGHGALNISEFDRTNKAESGLIKDLITKGSFTVRRAYAAEEEFLVSRCSFIASVNPIDILRDSGGNTRYAILPLLDIVKDYKMTREFSLQCLAQGRSLADRGFVASTDSWLGIRRMIEDLTPESIEGEIGEWWTSAVVEFVAEKKLADLAGPWHEVEERGYLFQSESLELLERGKRVFGLSVRQLKAKLRAARLGSRTASGDRVFLFSPKK